MVLMNSFNTDDDTQKLLKKYGNVHVELHSFSQSRYPRINRETYMPIATSVHDNDLEWFDLIVWWKKRKREEESKDLELFLSWYPPGHGNFYDSFYNSGLVDKFIGAGKKYIFLSNIDNLGATVDLNILNHICNDPKQPEFIMEVTDKTRADVKGGTLIEYDDRLMLLEIAQVPKDYVDEFKSVSKFR